VGVAAAPRYEDGSVGAAVEDGRTGGAGTVAPGATAAIGRSCANSTGPRQPAATAASARRNEARVIRTASFWLREPQRMVNVTLIWPAIPAAGSSPTKAVHRLAEQIGVLCERPERAIHSCAPPAGPPSIHWRTGGPCVRPDLL